MRQLAAWGRLARALVASAALLPAQLAGTANEVSLDPSDLGLPEARAAELRIAMEAADWNRAESLLFDSVASDQTNADLQRALGIAHYQAGRHFLAASALKRADSIEPLTGDTRYLLASAFIRVERRHWARAELEMLIAAGAHNDNYRYALARIYYDQQRFGAGVAELSQAIQQSPEFAEAHDLLGQCLEGLARFDEAAAAFRRAIALNAGKNARSAWPHFHLGSLQHDLGDIDAAEASLQEAVAANPKIAPAYRELGIVLRKAKKLAEAAEVLQAAAKLAPADATIQYSLAGVYREMEKADAAAAALQRFRTIKSRREH